MTSDPAAVVAALRRRGPVVWLDGASDEDGLGRYSLLGSEPRGALFAWGRRILHLEGSHRTWETGCPLVALERRLGALREGGASPRARAMGWLGYEVGRRIERLPIPADDTSELPDAAWWLYPDVLIFDRFSGAWSGGTARQRESLTAGRPVAAPGPPPPLRLTEEVARDDYVRAVQRIREHILEGDVYQVNLSRRFRGVSPEDPLEVYLRLRARRPAPLGAYIEADRVAVLSNSPERFLHRAGARVETRPIKGTRPRGSSPAEDEASARALLESEKDAAELTMIVDLMRNDLGRVARPGSVRVPSLRRLVSLPTVHHLVATVEAEVGPTVGVASLLRATFPAGSITGCPKIRAMEIIAALEPCRRGVYTGAIGWIGVDGDLSLNVAIRTLTMRRGRWSFHAGGGVVLDSDPQAEFAETTAKAVALREALGS